VNGPMNGWVKVVAQVGFPIAIALILLGMLTGYVSSPITSTAATLAAHVRDDTRLIRLLQRICFNTAEPRERRFCFDD